MRFFLMSNGPLKQTKMFLGQNVCSVARLRTDMKVKTEDTLFHDFSIFSFNLSSRIGPISIYPEYGHVFFFSQIQPVFKDFINAKFGIDTF